VSPTVFRHKSYRFFFFSREEARMHIHVSCPEGEAKFWLEPTKALRELQRIVETRKDEIIRAWEKHFKS